MSIWQLLGVLWELFRDAVPARGPERRSLRLMCRWLSGAQARQFARRRHFDVVGSHTGRRYRITIGTSANVHELDSFENSVARWCFVPDESLPAGDVMLAQKIALENDELSALVVGRCMPP